MSTERVPRGEQSTPESSSSVGRARGRGRGARRSWVSIALLTVSAGMVLTGLMSYLFAYNADTAGVHTWFGLAFIGLVALHLTNNGKSLVTYLRARQGRRHLAAATVLALAMTGGVVLSVPPFHNLIDLGRDLRRSVELEEGFFQVLTTRIGQQGQPIIIELRAGKHYESAPQPLALGLTFTTVPQVAFWVEDLAGGYLDTLYVSKKSAEASFVPAEDPLGSTERPEALPYWSHKRRAAGRGPIGAGSGDGELDAVTGATPLGHYDVRSVVASASRKFRVLMEINRSFDFNEFYSPNRFPEDPVYSGSGSSGQPSVVYSALVDLDDGHGTYFMHAIGHGHHSGRDGELYPDLEGIDTALELVRRVVVEVPDQGGRTRYRLSKGSGCIFLGGRCRLGRSSRGRIRGGFGTACAVIECAVAKHGKGYVEDLICDLPACAAVRVSSSPHGSVSRLVDG